MPNILVKVPRDAFPGVTRSHLLRSITEAAATAEQIPADPKKRFTSWAVLEEIEPAMWACAGVDMSSHVLPCIAIVYVPAGVLDEASKALYVKLMHSAFKEALPSAEKRQLATSVILHEVTNGMWGVNGTIWTLPDLAKAAGYEHLQHLVIAD
jgi:phenylpyruvate tautomerase PptA (4-oxalocrotonate tautomerase family)